MLCVLCFHVSVQKWSRWRKPPREMIPTCYDIMLAGGFKYLLFSPLITWGNDSHLTCAYFSNWIGLKNHQLVVWVVVSNIFYFHPYLGKVSNLTNIFQMDWNHQRVMVFHPLLETLRLLKFTTVLGAFWVTRAPKTAAVGEATIDEEILVV